MIIEKIYKAFRKPILTIMRALPGVRQLSRKFYYKQRGANYDSFAQSIPTENNTVLFHCFGGRQFGCTPKAIFEEIVNNESQNYTCIWAFKADLIPSFEKDPMFQTATIVDIDSQDYLDACARAKYWIFNTRVAEYIKPKSDQIYVQCWHGTPLKRLGFDVNVETKSALNTASELANRFKIDSEKWTYLISPSAYASKHLADAFGLDEERRPSVVLEEGYPRNDRIVRVCEDPQTLDSFTTAFRKELGIPTDKKILLYAPTWRDDSYESGKGYVMENTLLDFPALQAALGNEWVVLFRAHYYIANHFDFSAYEGFVYDVSKQADINDLYIVADALLTDYSSVFFDYANTARPIMFFWPDYQHYANDIRGFYFDLDELPGPHCLTNDEVIAAVQDLPNYEAKYGEDYAAFREKFCPKDDGHAAERVVSIIFHSA